MQTKTNRASHAGGVSTTLSLLLLGMVLTLAATVFTFRHLQPVIEQDLAAEVGTALQRFDIKDISVEGQDVILNGIVSSDDERDKIEEIAASVYGVSGVINQLTTGTEDIRLTSVENQATSNTQPDTEPEPDNNTLPSIKLSKVENEAETDTPTNKVAGSSSQLVDNNLNSLTTVPSTLTVVVTENKVSAQGIVSDVETINRINNVLAGKFGRDKIYDDLSSYENSITPDWLDGVLSMIDQLDDIHNPVIKVTGNDLVLGGTVVSKTIGNEKVATAERLLGAKLNVVDNLSVDQSLKKEIKPAEGPSTTASSDSSTQNNQSGDGASVVLKPAALRIKSQNNGVTLTGSVANNEQANAIRDGLDNLFGPDNYDDQLTVNASVESVNWIASAIDVVTEMRDISDFGLSINRGQMLLSGNVPDREFGLNLAIAATEITGNRLDILNNFSIRDTLVDSGEDLLAQSLMQELDALPTANIVFNKNSTTLTEKAQEVLDDVAAAILGYENVVIEISGHTDSSGDAVRNLRLSKQRAAAVLDFLVERNVPANRLRAIGYGETAPISDNETAQGRAANRRIEFNL